MRALAKLIVVTAALLMMMPPPAHAEDTAEGEIRPEIVTTKIKSGPCKQWGLDIWGLSYHPDRDLPYNEKNWGAGLGCYMRPGWKWLGKDPENRLVLQGDAMINSWRGLLVPVSIGVNYRVAGFGNGCKLFAVAALVAGYYQNPIKGISEVDVGPVPGVTVGCGPVRSNFMFVPSASKGQAPLAAVIASMTVLF